MKHPLGSNGTNNLMALKRQPGVLIMGLPGPVANKEKV